MKHRVTVPKSELRRQLDEAEAIKAEMGRLLGELETQAAGRPATRAGAWRHDPAGWRTARGVSPAAAPGLLERLP